MILLRLKKRLGFSRWAPVAKARVHALAMSCDPICRALSGLGGLLCQTKISAKDE